MPLEDHWRCPFYWWAIGVSTGQEYSRCVIPYIPQIDGSAPRLRKYTEQVAPPATPR